MADQDLWVTLQHLNLGSERTPLRLSSEATNQRDAEHRLSLIVKGLHSSQNPAGIKVMMPKIWKLEGRITSGINEDGSVQFFFKQEHQLLTILDNGPWTYKDWLVVVDRWTRRTYPDYLRIIRFWVKILNLPDDSRNDRVVSEVGGVLGHVDEIHIQQPTSEQAGEVWVRVPIDISAKLTFASLNHLASGCNVQIPEPEQLQVLAPAQNPAPEGTLANENQLVDSSRTPTEVADDTMGETVGSNLNMDISDQQVHDGVPGESMNFMHPDSLTDRINLTFAVREVDAASAQGLRNPLTIPYLKDINRKYKIDILFLVETKNKDNYVQQLGKELLFDHHFLVSPDGLSGGLAIFWKDSVQCEFLDSPTLHYTDMYISEGSITFCLSYVYGNPERKPRQQLWNRMMALAQAGLYQRKPRLVLGDFNEIKSNEEKIGGANRPDWQLANFQRMINISGLQEFRTFGGPYTWIGNRSCGTIKSKLDRVLASADWQEQYPKAKVQLLDWCGSDHKPLLLQTEDNKWRGKKLFRYDNRWRNNIEVHKLIQSIWRQQCAHISPQNFAESLKRCRNGLSQWKSEHNQNSRKKIQQLQLALQKAYESSYVDYNYITEIEMQLQYEYRMEEEYWRTKSRIQWLHSGDKNTRYFHEKTKQRRSYNRITSLQDEDGNIKTSEEEIQDIIHAYFEQLYTSAGTHQVDSVLQHIQPKVTPEINSKLLAPVTEEEIFQAISSMNVDKAPGPDGFNAGFYKFHWQDIKADASWISPDSKIGIGWTLHDSQGRLIIRGSTSLGPTDTVLEAEAIALKEALLQMRRLNYHNVTFCGDSFTLFGYLEKNTHSGLQGMGPQEIQGFLQDIVLIAHDSYRFKYINRQANQLADELARNARIHNSPYVVSWIS
ncbi:unnamed protein product [Arabidopsis arenosa]|uniref:RNase H type-1 domain-containing protein n=1 Tax=Arabidopsis arenosa TaxID=38785 RepID=A0A8S2AR61_ARAAE|nr:unnamed protein product [Arabidopsis arenosa]